MPNLHNQTGWFRQGAQYPWNSASGSSESQRSVPPAESAAAGKHQGQDFENAHLENAEEILGKYDWIQFHLWRSLELPEFDRHPLNKENREWSQLFGWIPQQTWAQIRRNHKDNEVWLQPKERTPTCRRGSQWVWNNSEDWNRLLTRSIIIKL